MKVSTRQLILITVGTLALACFVFSPRLWLMREPLSGTFQWDRGLTFLKQCEDPLRRDIEPAMLWRLLPPALCHFAGLRGFAPFAVPWLGVLAVTGYVSVLARRRCDDWRFVAGSTLLFASSSAVLVPVHWYGLNDAWAWFGLLVVAFGRHRGALVVALLLTPWVDERFLIALPLALLVRGNSEPAEPWWQQLRPLLWIVPYAAVRLIVSMQPAHLAPLQGFLSTHLAHAKVVLPFAPLGWWMAWRLGWVAIVVGARVKPALLGSAAVLTLLAGALLAADLSRSAAMLTPLMLLGCFHHARTRPDIAARHVLLLGLLNLLLPAAHVTYDKIDLISPLPIELWRLIRILG